MITIKLIETRDLKRILQSPLTNNVYDKPNEMESECLDIKAKTEL